MHVDWGWIKQRPHFIAQHLAATNTLLILHPFSRKRLSLSGNSRAGLTVLPFFRLPFARRFLALHYLNRVVLRAFFWLAIRLFRPDIIWLTFPDLYDYLPANHNVPMVYDCMDDALGFDASEKRKTLLLRLEQTLLQKAAHVFCSSPHLQNKLHLRAPCEKKCTLVHNAYEPEFSQDQNRAPPILVRPGQVALGYIGTISPWIDFAALVLSLQHFPNLEIHFIGPEDGLHGTDWRHERMFLHGPVEHSGLLKWARCFDALIMPFQVTELTRSVDPVKLYEYIFFHQPIVSVYYPELERFSDFVTFYSSHEELLQVLDSYIKSDRAVKYSDAARVTFLALNTWDSRVKQITDTLAGI